MSIPYLNNILNILYSLRAFWKEVDKLTIKISGH